MGKMSRREGTIDDQGNGQWWVRLDFVIQGRRVRQNQTVHGTLDDAKAKLAEFRAEKRRALGSGVASYPTLQEYCERWVEHLHDVSARTRSEYLWFLAHHVFPEIGDRRLSQLKTHDFQQVISKLVKVYGSGARTVTYTHAVLGAAMRAAHEEGLTSRCAYAGIKTGGKQRRRKERASGVRRIRALSRKAYGHLRTFLAVHPLRVMFEILLRLGLRPQEAVGLTWNDVDGDQLTVRRALILIPGVKSPMEDSPQRFELGPCKTAGSHREIILDDVAHGLFEAQRAFLESRGFGTGGDYLVFPSLRPRRPKSLRDPLGTPQTPSNVWRQWKALIRKANKSLPKNDRIAPHSLYDLRHTAATWMADEGVDPYVIQERLGHTRMTTTELYIDKNVDRQRKAITKISAAFPAA